jgi:DNA repair exonuclease SbcCD ATPase subunit
MPKPEKQTPAIVRAAQALEDELQKLEALSRTVGKLRLDSEKNISKAAKGLNEAASMPERLGEKLRALAAAMQEMQQRQQAALEPLTARATEIQQRMQRLGEHMQAFAKLGEAAGQLTALLQSEPRESPSAGLEQAEAQLAQIAEGARALFEQARADDFPDVARQADALKQRIASLRGRLGRKG